MIDKTYMVFYDKYRRQYRSHCNNNGADVVLFLCHYSFLTLEGSVELLA